MENPTETKEQAHNQIQQFESHYGYDASYIHQMIDASIGGYEAFAAARGLGNYRDQLPIDAFFTAAITTMMVEDCGGCLELNIKMAKEAGVKKEIITSIVRDTDQLPEKLLDIHHFVKDTLQSNQHCPNRVARIKENYGEAGFVELALCIAGCRIYPTLKKSLLFAEQCKIPAL